MNTDEAKAILQIHNLRKLFEIWNDSNKQIDAEKIIDLATDILDHNMSASDTDEEQEQEKPYREYNKPELDDRNDLLGTNAQHIRSAMSKYFDNPYHVKVGIYERCPTCEKVGVSLIKLDHQGDNTIVYHRYRHDYSEHRVRLAKFNGVHTWEDIVNYYKKQPEKQKTLPEEEEQEEEIET